MKKIGIMSMQRVRNYGSFMQAYGLKQIIEKIDENKKVEFIDFKPGETINSEIKMDEINDSTFKQKVNKKIVNGMFAIKHKFLWLPKYLKIGKPNNNKEISTLVIGSDEVFNCTQAGKNIGFSKDLFGQSYYDTNVISYAASFGYTTIDRLEKYKIKNEVKKMLDNNFNSISVRDENSKKIVEELIKKTPEINLDPVLVSDVNKLAKGKIKENNYIILYSYACRITEKENEIIKKFAKRNNKKIISIGTYQSCADKNITVDPFKMLNYFKNADFIITDTFHGTIFSIIFNKEFTTIIRNSNSNKLVDLLERLNLAERKINDLNKLDEYILNKIDYSITNDIILKEKENTFNYLKNNIK